MSNRGQNIFYLLHRDYKQCVRCTAYEQMGWFGDEYDEEYCSSNCKNASQAQFVMSDEIPERGDYNHPAIIISYRYFIISSLVVLRMT